MSTITTRDGTEIFYKDWSEGQPVVLSHGWPLSADAWDAQMVFLGERGYRVIAHDRRDVILVGLPTGGGEVARYIGRHGTERVARVVLLGAVPPLMLKTEANPAGQPIAVFDQIRAGTFRDRSQFFKDLAVPFYGYNRTGAKVSQGIVDAFLLQLMQRGIKSVLDCIKQFSETDFTE